MLDSAVIWLIFVSFGCFVGSSSRGSSSAAMLRRHVWQLAEWGDVAIHLIDCCALSNLMPERSAPSSFRWITTPGAAPGS
jgi:hypothetical protein